MIDTLRLLTTDKCERTCVGCCNNTYILTALQVCTDYTPYKKICLTGGEPMLSPQHILKTVVDIRKQTNYPIYLYTADVRDEALVWRILKKINGLTLTLHGRGDVDPFLDFNYTLLSRKRGNPLSVDRLSLRLNVFKTARFPDWAGTSLWDTRRDMDWLPACPVLPNEVFMRTEELCPERGITPWPSGMGR